MIEVFWHKDGTGEAAACTEAVILSDEMCHVVSLTVEDWRALVAAWHRYEMREVNHGQDARAS